MRKYLKVVSVLSLLVLMTGCAGSAQGDVEKITAEKNDLQMKVQQLTAEKTEFETKLQNFSVEKTDLEKQVLGFTAEITQLKTDGQKVQADLATASQTIKDFTQLKEKYGALTGSEADALIAANERKAEEDKTAIAKLQAEAVAASEKEAVEQAKAANEAAKAAEATAKKGYDTGITFSQLARTPDDYDGEKVKFTGEVIQVIDSDSEINLRVAVNSNYDRVILVYYPPTLLGKRVLEDDIITLYGTSQGLYTYDSTMGGKITIPLIEVDKLDIK